MAVGKNPAIQATRLFTNNAAEKDLEQSRQANNHFVNDTVHSISWENLSVTVEDRRTKTPLTILSSASGHVEAGKVLALMGPSGCGKTTMLNALAHRLTSSKTKTTGTIQVNGQAASASKLSYIARYVEQEDALIGSLTVKESIYFSAQLALPSAINKAERMGRVKDALHSFGIEGQADTLVGTPLRKGISGGQKRRLSVASQLVTSPKILFLDEPTSGLDSAASREVMSYISRLAKQLNLIVIISIHQPSTTTFDLLDQIMLLSSGKTCFFGAREDIEPYFESISHPIPLHINPAEFLLDLVNIDFAIDKPAANAQLDGIHQSWSQSPNAQNIQSSITQLLNTDRGALWHIEPSSRPDPIFQTLTLLHRSFIKSYRDVIAYQVRIAMYLGLAIMMGTVWLRLPYTQTSIQTFINAIFFGGAFMSFMAVAYIPAYLEDFQMFRKERANGLYGPLPFTLANFLIGLPYLFLISILFSVIAYWLANLRPTASGFWLWVLYLFLDLLAAEGLVVLIASLMPIFVVALAVTAFANGLWMCVGGFLVPPGTLNVFWKYVFHYIDYQAWVTQGLIINQFKTTIYDCAVDNHGGWNCMYPSDLMSEGKIRGTAVIEAFRYGYGSGEHGKIIGIMIGIIAAYRLFGYLLLVLKRT
ncbi:hypothetical protein H2198_000041 [Neophaeococcomyces mojaviensis]|uniref:Uncharacterized protein n=1 Tax=Neophaeococcomyces mojaviensis TaxID=3383035 RepID=A0ACC3AKT7_9EURO|nr:hypothetical protein H2198_000041 [Knufia sp. JES_112]